MNSHAERATPTPGPICVERIAAEGATAACRLMASMAVGLAGMAWPAMHRAVVYDALRLSDVVLLLATCGQVPCGLVVCIAHWRRYWRRFPLRHPLLAARLFLTRAARRRRAPAGHITSGAGVPTPVAPYLAEASGIAWGQSSPHIAKVAFIGVLPEWRGRGVARALYERLFHELAAAGVNRVDARIGLANLSSLRLHHRCGWRIELDADGLIATVCPTTAVSRSETAQSG